MRDLFLKSSQLKHNSTALIYETKGNPSKITFFSNTDEKLSILISANTTKDRLNINTNQIKVKSNCPELNTLTEILGFEKTHLAKNNYIHIQKNNKPETNKIATIDFYNKHGDKTPLQIIVKKILN